MKCKYKESCGYEFCLEEDCPEYKAVSETNADRIRSMSDEELTAFMQEPFCDKRTNGECKGSFGADCDQCILDWLKQPAEAERDSHAL